MRSDKPDVDEGDEVADAPDRRKVGSARDSKGEKRAAPAQKHQPIINTRPFDDFERTDL